jgi:hypothetical protein
LEAILLDGPLDRTSGNEFREQPAIGAPWKKVLNTIVRLAMDKGQVLRDF